MTEEKKSLTEKLINAQAELKAPKGQYNSFGKYKYRSAEDILEGVKPVNAKYGLLLHLSDEPVYIGDWHYIKATASITDGNESVTVTAYARESAEKKGMDHSQITGTASSYARKYALNGLYLIDDTKDADTDEYKQQQNKPQQAPKKATQQDVGNFNKEVAAFSALMKEQGKSVTPEQVKETLGINDPTQATQETLNQAIAKLKKWSEK